MQALCLSDRLRFVTDHPAPTPGPGEALVRVHVAGICTTDLELLRGYHQFQGVLGHEFVGVVESAPTASWVGERVVAEINCGPASDNRHAADRTVLGVLGRDGAFAELVAVPEPNLHRVPAGLADEAALFCEPLAAALRLREQLCLRPSDRMAVIGPGRLGLLIAQVLAVDGATVTVLGRRAEALELPMRLGFNSDLAAYVPDSSFDLVIDASGTASGLHEAIRLTRPLGTIALKSTYATPKELNPSDIVVKELTVVGSRCGPFAPALHLLERGTIEVHQLIEAEYALRDGLRAFERAAVPGALKVLLRPGG